MAEDHPHSRSHSRPHAHTHEEGVADGQGAHQTIAESPSAHSAHAHHPHPRPASHAPEGFRHHSPTRAHPHQDDGLQHAVASPVVFSGEQGGPRHHAQQRPRSVDPQAMLHLHGHSDEGVRHGGEGGVHHQFLHPTDHAAHGRDSSAASGAGAGGETSVDTRSHRQLLRDLATQGMRESGFHVSFDVEAMKEAVDIEARGVVDAPDAAYRDMRQLLWVSIDNDDTRDIDQVTAAEAHADGSVTLYIGVADVDMAIAKDGPIDQHAHHNTTSIYTPAVVFTMLPEQLCFDLTSLKPDVDRKAVVVAVTYSDMSGAHIVREDITLGLVRNQAKLAYNGVSAWLDGGVMPAPLTGRKDLQDNIILQDKLMCALLEIRRRNGTLEFDRPELNVVFEGDTVAGLRPAKHTRSSRLIENAMIAANNAMSRFLAARGYAIIQRVLPKSDRWEEIVALAQQHHVTLSPTPDSRSLRALLAALRAQLSDRLDLFQDQCLNIIKLLGRGEYVAFVPGGEPQGHFALAVSDYAHSTAPNRRYPDVIVHRILKASLRGQPNPYDTPTLAALAAHCSEQEALASKLERRLHKSAACILLRDFVGEHVEAIITGSSEKGTYARFSLRDVPAEGRLVRQSRRYRVGEKVQTVLQRVDVEHGFIDLSDRAAATPSPGPSRQSAGSGATGGHGGGHEGGSGGGNGGSGSGGGKSKFKHESRQVARRHQEMEDTLDEEEAREGGAQGGERGGE